MKRRAFVKAGVVTAGSTALAAMTLGVADASTPVNVVVTPVTVPYHTPSFPVSASVTLLDGTPANGGHATFSLSAAWYGSRTHTTIVNGIASTIMTPVTLLPVAAQLPLWVIVGGGVNPKYDQVYAVGQLKVVPADVTVVVPNIVIPFGVTTFPISATVTYADGSPVETGLITFGLGHPINPVTQQFTASVVNGAASGTIPSVGTIPAGHHILWGILHPTNRYNQFTGQGDLSVIK